MTSTRPERFSGKEASGKLLDRLLLAMAFVLAFVYSFRRMSDSDLWGHLKCGEYFFQKGAILRTHYFNCSWPDFPYLNHEWLFQALIYRLYSYAGEPGLIVLQVLLILSAFLLLYRILRIYSDDVGLIALVLGLGVIASSHRFALRPQHFSYVFLLYYLFSLHAYQQGRKRFVYALPFIMVLWVNMHAESLWGVMVPAVFICVNLAKNAMVQEKNMPDLKTLVIVFIGILVASMVNPFTYKTIFWPLLVMKEQFAGVEELLAPTGSRYLVFWIYFAAFAVLAVWNIRRVDPAWLLLSLIYAAIAWTANRGIPHFVFVSAPVLVAGAVEMKTQLRQTLRLPGYASSMLRASMLTIALYLVIAIATSPAYFQKYDNIIYPEGAVRFMKEQGIRGNILNSHPWGGYLIWNAYPDLKPYIDGRFFHKRFYDEYYHILSVGAGWQDILGRYNISLILLPYSPGSGGTLNDRLFSSLSWRLVYWDDAGLLYMREGKEYASVLDRHAQRHVNPDRQLYEFPEADPGILAQANAAAERNLEQAGHSYRALIVAANTSFNLRRYEKALERYLGALSFREARHAWTYFRIALCYRNLGDLERAGQYLNQSVSLAPDFRDAQQLSREIKALLTR